MEGVPDLAEGTLAVAKALQGLGALFGIAAGAGVC